VLASTRVELATAIAVAFPRSPMTVAYRAWDLHAQSGGRFQLGLGTQVKGHNERRFSTPWTAPVPRIREYAESLRAIWRCWEAGEKLDYRGEHYQFTLMTPEFSPPPNGFAPPPILLAALGPAMLKLAGRVADGVRLHSFNTRKYMEEVTLKRVAEGLALAGRDRAGFEVVGGGFIATGSDADAVAERFEWARYRVAFYGSTRTYLPVFAVHGLEERGSKLHALSVAGKWDEMAAEVPDEVVRLFTAVGTYDEIGAEIERMFAGASDTVRLDLNPGTDVGIHREVVQEVQRIPSPFTGHKAAA
jgi:probable F420-dependent oxidoreductase